MAHTIKFAETVFSYVDHMMTARPNVFLLACEAFIMFTKNKTHEWLQSKDVGEADKLLHAARKEANDIRRLFHQRHQEISQARQQMVQEKIAKAQEAKHKKNPAAGEVFGSHCCSWFVAVGV